MSDINERQLLLAVMAASENVSAGQGSAQTVAYALGIDWGYEAVRPMDRALRRARERGLIVFDKRARIWRLTDTGKATAEAEEPTS